MALSAIAAAAEVQFHEPDGFGEAKFGMPVAEVGHVYQTLRPAKIMEGATGKGPRMLMIYDLDDQPVGPLAHCHLELRFFNDELYEIEFRCPERAKVGQYMQKTYGLPTKVTATTALWTGKHSSVAFDGSSGAFVYRDLARGQAMQAALDEATAQAHASPGATPPDPGVPHDRSLPTGKQ